MPLEIITSPVAVELGRYDADIALRVVRPTRESLKVRRADHMTHSVYGNCAHVKKHLPSTASLWGHFIAWDASYIHLPTVAWPERELPGCRRIALATTSLPPNSLPNGLGSG